MTFCRCGSNSTSSFVLLMLFLGSAGSGCRDSPPAAPQTGAASSPNADSDPPNKRSGWPTEEEVKAALFKVEHGIHASDTNKSIWHVKDMRHEVHEIRFGERTTEKQMSFGAAAITVHPVKVRYTRITEYTDKPEVRDEVENGVWFFYRDSFGDWTGKFGSE